MTDIDIFEIPSHPSADLFPMLDDDELDDLAADIKANGLLMPLIVGELDGQPVLVDGRNRREACRRAGIVPHYTLLSDGEDLSARIVSENVHRRHLTKGQRAMIVVKVIGLGYGKGKSHYWDFDDNPKTLENRLSQARTVLRHAPDLGDSVINGSLSLENAYEEARVRKGRAETYESRFEALKAAAPDLADLVVEERLKLEEAEAAERERAEQARQRKKLLAHAPTNPRATQKANSWLSGG